MMDWSGLGPVPCLPPDLVPMQLTTCCCLLICLESVCYCLSQRSVLPLSPAEIPRRELEAVLRRLGHGEPSDDELDAVAAMAAQPPAPGGEDDLMEAFWVFDADGNDHITAEELRAVREANTCRTAGLHLHVRSRSRAKEKRERKGKKDRKGMQPLEKGEWE